MSRQTLTNYRSRIPGVKLNGTYTPLKDLPSYLQKCCKSYKQIVLVREYMAPTSGKNLRSVGTLWYGGKPLLFTVEDIPRKIKIDKETALPATDDGNFQTKDPGKFYICFEQASKSAWLQSQSISLPLKRFSSSGGVFKNTGGNPRKGLALIVSALKKGAGTKVDAKDIAYYNPAYKDLDSFSGTFFHGGVSEVTSHGCIIISSTRKNDGTIVKDFDTVKKYYKWLYDQKSPSRPDGFYYQKCFVIFNLWEVPKDPPKEVLLGKVRSGETGYALKQAKILYPDEVKRIQSEGDSIYSGPLTQAPTPQLSGKNALVNIKDGKCRNGKKWISQLAHRDGGYWKDC